MTNWRYFDDTQKVYFREYKRSRMPKKYIFAGINFRVYSQFREIRESFYPRDFLPIKYMLLILFQNIHGKWGKMHLEAGGFRLLSRNILTWRSCCG